MRVWINYDRLEGLVFGNYVVLFGCVVSLGFSWFGAVQHGPKAIKPLHEWFTSHARTLYPGPRTPSAGER